MGIKLTDSGTRTEFISILNPPTLVASTGVVTFTSIELLFTPPVIQGTAMTYTVYDDGTGLVAISGIAYGATTIVVPGLAASTLYVFKIVTADLANESTFSNTAGDTTAAAPAGIMYNENGESGAMVFTPNPEAWPLYLQNDAYGPGNFVNISTDFSNNGTYSMKLDMAGRNSLTNATQPFNRTEVHTSDAGHQGVSYFISSVGTDLSAYAGVNGGWIWKKAGFSRHDITAVSTTFSTNDTLTLTLLDSSIDGLPELFSGGDGVNLSVKPQAGDRRSDADIMIGHMDGDTPTLTYGQSYFKRWYFRPEFIEAPDNHMKLSYLYGSGVVYIGNQSVGNNSPASMIFSASYLNGLGTAIFDEIAFGLTNGKWYYVEVETKFASAFGAGDGEMKVWFGEKGVYIPDYNAPLRHFTDTHGEPYVKSAGLTYAGNIQHFSDISGAIYYDDMMITEFFNGLA